MRRVVPREGDCTFWWPKRPDGAALVCCGDETVMTVRRTLQDNKLAGILRLDFGDLFTTALPWARGYYLASAHASPRSRGWFLAFRNAGVVHVTYVWH